MVKLIAKFVSNFQKDLYPVQKMQEKLVTLTPNKRLARHLQKQFCIEFVMQNQAAWQTLSILPIKTWLTNCWLEYRDPRILLSRHQERLLWKKIIIETLGEKFISLTNIAMDAHELINSYLLEEHSQFAHEPEDIAIFQRINLKFKTLCENKNFVTTSQLPSIIIPYLSNHSFKKITLAGFDEYRPQLQKLIEAIKESGCKIIELDPNNYQNSITKKAGFNNLKQEITTSAKWAKQLLNKNDKDNIGIVVPNLVNLRSQIAQIFYDIINNDKAINISTGIPLISTPIINSALNLLSLTEPFEAKAISKILSSPYIAGIDAERSQRCILDLKLREQNNKKLELTDIKRVAKEINLEIPLLISKLENWHKIFAKTQNSTLCTSKWSQIFMQILQCFGWPGENSLTDIEANAAKQLTKLFQNVTSSKLVVDKTSCKKAFQILYDLAINSTLQPEREIDTPINIIGSLEAAGLNFDHLWVMGLDQESWPPVSYPNPFIPIETQKKFSLPHSSAQRELHFCEMLIERYKRSAKEIIFSYVKQSEDHSVESSSLLSDVPEISDDDLDLTDDISTVQKIYQSKKLEKLTDNIAPKVSPSEELHTGSKLIELQSLCPFQAFVEFRLATKEPQKIEPGISRIQRGIVIHETLENFWRKIRTQQKLLEMEPTKIENLIQEIVGNSLDKLKLNQNLYELEKQCLISLLSRWIELEKTRLPFQVNTTEKTAKTDLSSLPINLRIDRIDQVADGSRILIDYKTGKHIPSSLDWFGDRPKNIQLLLYSVALGSVQGIAIAQINSESVKFKEVGLKELSFGLNKIDPNHKLLKGDITWDAFIEYWHDILDKLATDFTAGNATPTPVSPQICKRCSFGSICRVSQA